MRLHIVDGALSTLPHRLAPPDDREMREIVSVMDKMHDEELVDAENVAQFEATNDRLRDQLREAEDNWEDAQSELRRMRAERDALRGDLDLVRDSLEELRRVSVAG